MYDNAVFHSSGETQEPWSLTWRLERSNVRHDALLDCCCPPVQLEELRDHDDPHYLRAVAEMSSGQDSGLMMARTIIAM